MQYSKVAIRRIRPLRGAATKAPSWISPSLVGLLFLPILCLPGASSYQGDDDRLLPVSLSNEDLDRLWKELADADPAHAYKAIFRLASCPARTPEFLGKQLKPATKVDEKTDLLKEPEQLRALRAVESLEYVATPGAQQVLKRLAEGVPGARLTQDARVSLERLAKAHQRDGDKVRP
jgi:hypothetical protein